MTNNNYFKLIKKVNPKLYKQLVESKAIYLTRLRILNKEHRLRKKLGLSIRKYDKKSNLGNIINYKYELLKQGVPLRKILLPTEQTFRRKFYVEPRKKTEYLRRRDKQRAYQKIYRLEHPRKPKNNF